MNNSDIRVKQVVDKILRDSLVSDVSDIAVSEASPEVRNTLMERLREKDTPVLGTPEACGPG